jgi:hypothetical protein
MNERPFSKLLRRINSEYGNFVAWLFDPAPSRSTISSTRHSIDATAETLYEALAQALAALRHEPWAADIGSGLTTATVKVRHPEVTHVVRIQEFEKWLNNTAKSPADMLLKTRLRQLLRASDR